MTPAHPQELLAILYLLVSTQTTGWLRNWCLGAATACYTAALLSTICPRLLF